MLHNHVHSSYTDPCHVGYRCTQSHWGVLGHLPADPPAGYVVLWPCLYPSCSLWPCQITSMSLGQMFPYHTTQERCAGCLSHVRELWLPQEGRDADAEGVAASSAQPGVLQLFLPSPRFATENPGNVLSKQFVRLESQHYSVLKYMRVLFTWHVHKLSSF